MRAIDLKEIIAKQGLDPKEVAKQLFPGNKYPKLAMNRVIAKDAVLDANQISKLALMADIPIGQLYSGEDWKAKSKKSIHTFTNGQFRAELNTDTWITKIFHKDSLFHESIIHNGSIPLSEYLHKLNLQIENFKKHE